MSQNKKNIGIIDYGMGNVGSIKNMFSKLDIWSEIIDNPSKIADKTAIILPGVGRLILFQKLKTLGLVKFKILLATNSWNMLGMQL